MRQIPLRHNSEKFQRRLMELDIQQGMSDLFEKKLRKTRVIRYPFRAGIWGDVRNAFKQTEEDDQELLDYYGRYVDAEWIWDKIAVALAKAVNIRIKKYILDGPNWGHPEHWASPIDVHRKEEDDCDGNAVLTCYLWGLFGIPDYRRFVRAGYSINNGKRIGHATAIYCSLETNEFYPLEGSFLARESLNNFNKIPLRFNDKYVDTWWITNENKSYGRSWLMQFI